MIAESYAEFVGLTAEAIALIEQARQSPTESKSAILVRVLAPTQPPALSDVNDADAVWFDYGEGIRIREGEPLFLFLNRPNRHANKPDAKAEIRKDGFFLEGEYVGPSDKRQFTPAMKIVQARKNHIDKKGNPISTSAMRRWCVLRGGELVRLDDIKDPKLARRRNVLSVAERKKQKEELLKLVGLDAD
jgi:hypothetical protein